MTDQVQQQQEQQTVTVGFEDALNKNIPNWRALPQEEIDRYRLFYARGVQDLHVFMQVGASQMGQGMTFLVNSINTTARPQQEAPAKPARKPAAKKAPAAKVAKKAPAKRR